MSAGYSHESVLPKETMELLLTGAGLYVDGTLGGGGHSELILENEPEAVVFGIDRDGDAIKAASERLERFGGRFSCVRGSFGHIKRLMTENGIPPARGILLDIGASSHQFDTADRGFSYHTDSRLDMRMDRRQSLSAYEVVNGYGERDLARIIKDYGEENWARRVAQFICKMRPIETTSQLVEAILAAIPAGARQGGPHPARRTFQAIRIEVNGELDALNSALGDAIDCLENGGRLCVITFHSLEDRIVKQAFASMQDPCTCPKSFPMCVCGKKPLGRLVMRKPVTAGEDELTRNPRAKSAKLRAFEKTVQS